LEHGYSGRPCARRRASLTLQTCRSRTMVHSILVPLDGSKFSEQAVPLAVRLAESAGGNIQLAHVHEPLTTRYPRDMHTWDIPLDSALKHQPLAHLHAMVSRVRKTCKSPVTSRLLEGNVVDAIGQEAKDCNAELVVMTSHGRGLLARAWLGSVAD